MRVDEERLSSIEERLLKLEAVTPAVSDVYYRLAYTVVAGSPPTLTCKESSIMTASDLRKLSDMADMIERGKFNLDWSLTRHGNRWTLRLVTPIAPHDYDGFNLDDVLSRGLADCRNDQIFSEADRGSLEREKSQATQSP